MARYINGSINERSNTNSGQSCVLWVVGISFGLLCIVQSVLNVTLRLQRVEFCNRSDLAPTANVTLTPNANVSALLLERDQLEKENIELQARNFFLTTVNEVLNITLSQQQDYIKQLQSSVDELTIRLTEMQPQVRSCSPGWTQHKSSCYQLSTETRKWRTALKDCMEKGAHPVIINDDKEEDFLHSLGSSEVWIGLNGRKTHRQMIWTWVDGSQLTDTNKFQPHPESQIQRLYCASSRRSPSGLVSWIRESCVAQHRWVCEREIK